MRDTVPQSENQRAAADNDQRQLWGWEAFALAPLPECIAVPQTLRSCNCMPDSCSCLTVASSGSVRRELRAYDLSASCLLRQPGSKAAPCRAPLCDRCAVLGSKPTASVLVWVYGESVADGSDVAAALLRHSLPAYVAAARAAAVV
jgi:hypothetical protein